jgi:hypothetical protein
LVALYRKTRRHVSLPVANTQTPCSHLPAFAAGSDGLRHRGIFYKCPLGQSVLTRAGAVRSLGGFGSPISDPRKPRIDFFPFMGCGFETFIRRDLIVRVRFLARLTFFRFVKTATAYQE